MEHAYDGYGPEYMERVAPHCHRQVPVLSLVGKGPKGDKGDRGPEGPAGDYYLTFDTVAAMQAFTKFEPGMHARTMGFHEAGDGGGAWYKITDDATANGMDIIECGNLFAELQVMENIVTPEMFGAWGDGGHDDSDAIKQAITYGVEINCQRKYLIQQDIPINDNNNGVSPYDVGNYKRIRIVGRTGTTTLHDSSADLERFNEDDATFLFDGGSFTLQGTSGIDFESCVFMGKLTNDKTETAFMLIKPARKLKIDKCVFQNLQYGVYFDEEDPHVWSGEHIFSELYFAYCEYCIYFKRAGYDSIVRGCIAQGSCDYGFYFSQASNLLFTANHDYTKNGSYFVRAANIVNNYFDGFRKLHIQPFRISQTNPTVGTRPIVYSLNIVGNTFFIGEKTDKDTSCVVCEQIRDDLTSVFLMDVNFSNNMLTGFLTEDMEEGQEEEIYKIAWIDVTDCTHIGYNCITNNVGENIQAVFKGANTENKQDDSYYYNYEISGYNNVYFDVDEGVTNSKTQQVHYDRNGLTAIFKMTNAQYLGRQSARLVNLPPHSMIITQYFIVKADNSFMYEQHTGNYVYVSQHAKSFIVTMHVRIGSRIDGDIAYTI